MAYFIAQFTQQHKKNIIYNLFIWIFSHRFFRSSIGFGFLINPILGLNQCTIFYFRMFVIRYDERQTPVAEQSNRLCISYIYMAEAPMI